MVSILRDVPDHMLNELIAQAARDLANAQEQLERCRSEFRRRRVDSPDQHQ